MTYATCHIILQGFALKRVILGIWDVDILPPKKPSPLPHAMILFIFQLGTVHNCRQPLTGCQQKVDLLFKKAIFPIQNG